MYGGSFEPDWRGDYISISQPGSLSPAYTLAKAAKRLIDAGRDVALPTGYGIKTLNDITWTLGFYDTPQRVTARQADELREIARVLRDNHSSHLTHDERDAVTRLQLLLG